MEKNEGGFLTEETLAKPKPLAFDSCITLFWTVHVVFLGCHWFSQRVLIEACVDVYGLVNTHDEAPSNRHIVHECRVYMCH